MPQDSSLMIRSALEFANLHRQANLIDLCEWLRIPSISTLPQHAGDVRQAATWVHDRLLKMDFEAVEIIETPRHPLVYAEKLSAPGPTLLIYGHFDVQPVDPIEEWHTPPFEPQVIGEDLFARGTIDDKGQVFIILAALEAYLRTGGRLPLNIKLLLEGEEEISSPNLPAFVSANRDKLAADAVLICDSEMLDPRTPVIMYGVRGNLKLDVEVRGPRRDLHSGTFGGAVDNPFNVLVRLLAALQDGQTRRILAPGFYDRVLPLEDEERELIASAPITGELALYLTGAPALGGEPDYSLVERLGVRPTFEIHGIVGGFTGEGSKTVIPARAKAKISTRLVPEQDPLEIAVLIEDYLKSLAPPTVQLEVKLIGKSWPVRIDYSHPAVQAAALACQRGIGAPPVYMRGGGSLPIVHDFIHYLSPVDNPIPVVMLGFGLPDGNTHAPDEKIHLPNFYHGIETIIHYLDIYSQIFSQSVD